MEDIELALDSADGVIDCRLEPEEDSKGELFYNATILYPNILKGLSRSDIFCYKFVAAKDSSHYFFDSADEVVHPKILKLEGTISAAIIAAGKSNK